MDGIAQRLLRHNWDEDGLVKLIGARVVLIGVVLVLE